MLLSSCKSSKAPIVEVPIVHKTIEGIQEVKLPTDSSSIRLRVEIQPSGQLSVKQESSNPGTTHTAPTISWEHKGDTLDITATQPERSEYLVTHTEVKEIPVQVEVPIEVNKLYWWQKVLMWVGILTVLSTIIAIIKAGIRIYKRTYP